MGLKINPEAFSWSFTDDGDGDPAAGLSQAMPYAGMMAAIFLAVIVVEVAVVVLLLRLTFPKPSGDAVKTLIVLGSGGHTAEMLKLVESLDKTRYAPRVYVVANTDAMSGRKANELEQALLPKDDTGKATSQTTAPAALDDSAQQTQQPWQVIEIPRSREVGQSYITSVWTTLVALVSAFLVVFQARPQVVLANGPGTCIPVCCAAVVLRLTTGWPVKVIYVESIARTRKLSLSGRILYNLRMADLLLVQWQELADKLPRAKFAGRLY